MRKAGGGAKKGEGGIGGGGGGGGGHVQTSAVSVQFPKPWNAPLREQHVRHQRIHSVFFCWGLQIADTKCILQMK